MATNLGSANAFPVIWITGPGRVYELVNLTTKEAIYFNLELESGETAVLDLRVGKKSFISSFRGSIWETILKGSDTELFHLQPGDNNISVLVDNALATMYMTWDTKFWSFDGVAE